VDLGLQYSPVHSFQPLATACQFHIHIIFRSFSTLSVHLFFGLPLFRIPFVLAFSICFGILSLFFLSLCPYHLHLSDFVNFTIPALCDVSCIPLLLFLQLFSSFMGPYIFLTIYLIPSEFIVQLLCHSLRPVVLKFYKIFYLF